MNKKTMVLIVSMTLTMNQMAFAKIAQSSVSEADLNAMLDLAASADQKTVADLRSALKEVIDLQAKLKAVSAANNEDLVLQYANRMQVVLIALTSFAMHSQFKGKEQSTMILTLATASAVVNAYIRHYKGSKNITGQQLSQIVFEASQEISKNKEITPELEQVTAALNTASQTLIQNQGQVAEIINQLGGGQDVVVLASVVYLFLHIAAPKVAKQADAVVKGILPKVKETLQSMQQLSARSAELAKKPMALGAGAAGVPDILSMTAGLSSEQSQKLILSTLINLDTTAKKLQAEINKIEKMK